MKTRSKGDIQGGFSLVELIVGVAVLALVATIGSSIWGGIRGNGRDVQFRSHVQMLNSAVNVYRANYGDLSGSLTGAEVITKLKSVADVDVARTINGLRGGSVDSRLRGVTQTAAEAASGERRAVWDSGSMRFEITTSGAAGFNRFVFDDAAVVVVQEMRSTSLQLASASGWVWDYADSSAAPSGYTVAGTEVAGPVTPPGGTGTPGSLDLNPPMFSIPGGSYEYSNFDLPLSFSNPNPEGTSKVLYSVSGSDFATYTGGTISVSPGDEVIAYAVSIDPDAWNDSSFSQEEYDSTFVITGNTTGLFSNPVGGPDMVTGGWGNYFTWGTPATQAGFNDPSWLLYQGASFVNVSEGEQFLLGTIEYYNGTILGGTGAEGLDLSIELAFEGGNASESFAYDLNLINSANLEGNTADQSADYVQFGDIYAEIPATLGGVEYVLVLEFGETSGNGFSTIDEFFVHEGETASGQLYGTLVRAWGEG